MNTSKVWKINLSKNADINELKEKTTKILEASNLLKIISKNKLVGVKQHFGEKGNEGYIKPEVTKVVLNKIKERLGKPLLIETNTLYHGERSNTYNHLKIAYEHGFNYENVGAPIVIMDGLNGQIQRGVEINGKHFKEVYVASDIPFFDSMIVLSHVKGHIMAGIGGAIKNMAMGLASRAGKLAQHADFKPSLNKKKCVGCGMCSRFCEHHAIEVKDKEWHFDAKKCAGCGECYTACPKEAISFNWAGSDDVFQEKLAEYAFGAIKEHRENKKTAFINYIYHITAKCDCDGSDNPVLFPDVAILASDDPVAIDKASYDLTKEIFNKDIFKEFWPYTNPLRQLEHACELGLGNLEYKIEEI